jgi:hypothetical protein
MKDYKLGKLLGFDVYIDLDEQKWQRETDKKKVLVRAQLIFEEFFRLHDVMNDLRELLTRKDTNG